MKLLTDRKRTITSRKPADKIDRSKIRYRRVNDEMKRYQLFLKFSLTLLVMKKAIDSIVRIMMWSRTQIWLWSDFIENIEKRGTTNQPRRLVLSSTRDCGTPEKRLCIVF